ncbi:uncharacterized protein LOC127008288 isoform X2 [Eriocheir sinensis]|uniref:uncharacterized protein LOC127008288 isoform X2 n=1 Tax=Eriocheir sinensis TaxID=95602 RepID=UPI0021C72198|nr:uncharacterized protein LOC127008288 isoform X2 [Eriocheir sinensis]
MEFSCQVCLSRYDSEGHRPLLLPACGHSFCAYCVQVLGQQGKTYCPKCRKENAVQPVSSLPVNYSLLEIVQSTSLGADADEPPEPPSNPMGGTTARKMPPHSSLPKSLSRPVGCTPRSSSGAHVLSKLLHNGMNQNSTSLRNQPMFTPASPTGYTSFPTPAASTVQAHVIRQPMFTTVNSYAAGYTSFPPPAASTVQACMRRQSMFLPVSSSAAGYTSFPAPARSTVQAHDPNFPEAGPEKELQDELDFQMAIHLTFCKDLNHDINRHHNCPVWRREREDNEDVASVLTFMQEI